MGLNFSRDKEHHERWTAFGEKGHTVAFLQFNVTRNIERDGKWYPEGAVFVTSESKMVPGSTAEMLAAGIKKLASGEICVDEEFFHVNCFSSSALRPSPRAFFNQPPVFLAGDNNKGRLANEGLNSSNLKT